MEEYPGRVVEKTMWVSILIERSGCGHSLQRDDVTWWTLLW